MKSNRTPRGHCHDFWRVALVLCLARAIAAGAPGRGAFHASFDLRKSCVGWEAGFADYLALQEPLYELAWDWVADPAFANRGFFISGSNLSDDLFMFIKHPISGLKPHGAYRVSAQVEILSRAPIHCLGIGGAPGVNVYVKFGASSHEPTPVLAPDGHVRMNVDIGHQSNGGADAIVIGDIATTITDCHNQVYQPKQLATPAPLLAHADEHGTLWIFVGTDSGFEGKTDLFYTQVSVRLHRDHAHGPPADHGHGGR